MNDKKISRRDFLIAAGYGCAGLALAGSGCSKLGGATATAALICPYGYRYDPWPGQCYRYVDSNGSGYCDLSEPVVTPTSPTTGQSDTSAQTAVAGESTTMTIWCDRHCAYPGQCGRFIDSDGSGYCDLSEGVVASAATAVPAAGPVASSAATTSPAATPATPTTTTAGSGSTTRSELVILCHRGCSYPGHCGRYTDADGSGRCDLSEGVPADQAANYAGAGGRGGRGGRGG